MLSGALRIVFLSFLLFFNCATSNAQDHELSALRSDVDRLYTEGKFSEAIAAAKQYVEHAERTHGTDHPEFAKANNWLAFSYVAAGRYKEAEPLYKRSLSIRRTTLGTDHADVGEVQNNLADLYRRLGRFDDAEPLFKNSLSIFIATYGVSAPQVGALYQNIADLYKVQSRFGEAEQYYNKSREIFQNAYGKNHSSVGTSVSNLAGLYAFQGRYDEAERLYQLSHRTFETALGKSHPYVGVPLNNLAEIYRAQGRYKEAEPLFNRSLEIAEMAYGKMHLEVGAVLQNLGELSKAQGRYRKAEEYLKRGLDIRENALGKNHPLVGSSLGSIAELYLLEGRYDDALPLYERDRAIQESAFGPYHPDVGTALHNLAELYKAQGRYELAIEHYQRSIGNYERTLGKDHPNLAIALSNVAILHFLRSNWQQAHQYFLDSATIVAKQKTRSSGNSGSWGEKNKNRELNRLSFVFNYLLKSSFRLGQQNGIGSDFPVETFRIAQSAAGSEAASSLAKMAARHAADEDGLSVLIRQRQDLVDEWHRRDAVRSATIAKPPSQRDKNSETKNLARLTLIDEQIARIDHGLASEFPDYAALANPEPLPVAKVQSLLGADEALIVYLDTGEREPTPEETFIWAVTKNDLRWVRSDVGTDKLQKEVAALRCGLDPSAWRGKTAKACAERLGIGAAEIPKSGKPLPFDTDRAHELYKALFGELGDLLAGKQLLIVPSGPLTQLPFHALVTEPSTSSDMGEVAWLAKKHTITVLPAVSSLKALRADAKASVASKPFIGFGNPLLDGNLADKDDIRAARLARTINGCAKASEFRTASLRGRRGISQLKLRGLRIADRDDIAIHTPLPETADELCRIARSVGANLNADIHLGANATETAIKDMNGRGKLQQYKVLSFATHGATAGQLVEVEEPGLILTPPEEDTSSEHDDGYLSASEIAGLKLDADLVILSACNTASGDAKNAEALSGLARTFFYAGARALLVSHWSVYSSAAIELVTGMFDQLKSNTKVGRAEALRQSMLRLIARGGKHAQPSYWAPFVIVGEGSAGG